MHTLAYNPDLLDPQLRAAFALLDADALNLATTTDSAAITLTATLDPAAAGAAAFTWDGQRLALRGGSIPQVLRALAWP